MNISDRISLRPAEPVDEPFLFRVYASGRSEELSRTGWDEAQQLAFLGMQFQAQSASYRANLRAWYQVIVVEGLDAGRLLVDRSDSVISLADIGLVARVPRPGDRWGPDP